MAAQGRGQQPPQMAQDDEGGAGMNPCDLSITILLLFLYVMMYVGEVQE